MENATTFDIFRLFWRSSLRYRVATFSILFAVGLSTILNLFSPWYLKRLIDLLAIGPGRPEIITHVIIALLIIVGLDLASQICWRVVGFGSVYMQVRVMVDLSEEAFRKTMAQSHHFFANSFAGALVRKINRLSGSFEEIADQITFSILPLTITIVGTIIGVSFRSRLIAAIIAGWIITFIIIQFWYSRWKQPVEIERAERDTESTGALADALSNSSTIRMFTGFIFEIRRYRATLQRWQTAMSRAWLLNEYGFAAQALSMAVVEAVVLVVAVRLWGRGILTVGDFILLQTYLSVLFRQLWDISRVFRRIYTSIANAAEIVEVMQSMPDVMNKLSARPLQIKQGAILFRGVDFSYHKTRKILSRFNLEIKPGERIALVGASGAGKTTITNLLLRLYDVEAGAILIDGQNIADVTQESLREAIAFVPQEPILFHRTLMENIRYGRREATDAEVIESSKRARCHDFISDLPQGYDTYVGERGIKLSGGERQRVAIARAILKNAPILVLDEATSSLDSESEALIQQALRELMSKKTAIAIAHRLSTIMQMNRIIVIENGRVIDQGTHQELLARQGVYQKLWKIQAGGFLP